MPVRACTTVLVFDCAVHLARYMCVDPLSTRADSGWPSARYSGSADVSRSACEPVRVCAHGPRVLRFGTRTRSGKPGEGLCSSWQSESFLGAHLSLHACSFASSHALARWGTWCEVGPSLNSPRVLRSLGRTSERPHSLLLGCTLQERSGVCSVPSGTRSVLRPAGSRGRGQLV